MPDEDAVVDPFDVMVAGEPVARKAGTAGSGRRPLEKDLEPTRHSSAAYRCNLPIRARAWPANHGPIDASHKGKLPANCR
jgi:hypothetical protein